ncbi:acyl-CoA dehydrogenase family protein [Nocardia lasii]|uniref:Acyl-CoA dehydrogenase family protein n=1 Tax=Nocardia lasii TaxID=1616107 RepID=A0ABW1JMS5_9NOCA
MRFALSTEQLDFAAELRKILDAGQVPAAVRAWGAGDSAAGRALLRQIADMGVFGLIVDEQYGGAEATAVDLVVAAIELGRAAVPGPVIESIAVIPALLQRLPEAGPAARWLPALASGDLLGTVAFEGPGRALALDADVADLVLIAGRDRVAAIESASTGASPGHESSSAPGDGPARPSTTALLDGSRHFEADHPHRRDATVLAGPISSIDPARKLFPVISEQVVAEGVSVDYAFDVGVLACAAQLLGAGRALLDQSVAYAKQRRQFGRAIGEFQVVKQQLADVRIGLDLAEPLVYRAALTLESDDRARDVSAALVACGDAAHRAARAGLQVHGAIGYTAECDLSLLLTRVAALRTAWGTADFHRGRIAATLRATALGAAVTDTAS